MLVTPEDIKNMHEAKLPKKESESSKNDTKNKKNSKTNNNNNTKEKTQEIDNELTCLAFYVKVEKKSKFSVCYLGIGSDSGDKIGNIHKALESLQQEVNSFATCTDCKGCYYK